MVDYALLKEKEAGLGAGGLPPYRDDPSAVEAEAYDEEVAHGAYFSRVASRSTTAHRRVTALVLLLAGACYYALFGGRLPAWPAELRPGSLRGAHGPLKWIGGGAGWRTCGGHHAHGQHHESEMGYVDYVARTAGLDHAARVVDSTGSRGGQGFGAGLDYSVATAPSGPGGLDGSTLAQTYESLFLSVPTAAGARASSRRYTNHTHVAGSKEDYNSAVYTARRWAELLGVDLPEKQKDFVYEAGSPESREATMGKHGHGHGSSKHDGHRHFSSERSGPKHGHKHGHGKPHDGPATTPRIWVDTYHIWLNEPLKQSLYLSAPPSEADPSPAPLFTASLVEDQVGDDPDNGGPSEVVPTYHGYSVSGAAKHAQVVYANLGRKEDYDALEAAGISLEGRIALVRYGGPFRGLKVRGAAQRGAKACLIYTDPAEDGEITTANGYKPYPEGPARQPSSIQRGSVQALSFYPGDPGTPGQPSYKNATRLSLDDADSLPKIPSLPISYRDAAPLLRALQGHGKRASELGNGKDWQGAVPGVEGEYWTGPSETVVASMENRVEYKVRKIWNAYAVIPGHVEDEVIAAGCHRDAWTFGGGDPISGTATLEQVVAGLGEMLKKGWKPLRTMMIASWDAEEFGLVGSTEHTEDFPDWIRENVVSYLNLDVAATGSAFGGRSSPSLTDLLVNVANKVDDPDSPVGAGQKLVYPRGQPLGSGSDYTSYLQHLGIASAEMGFSRKSTDPVYHYHSQYDSFDWMDKYGDPTWERHLAVAKVFGLAALRTASNLFVPLNVSAYAEELGRYVHKVEAIATQKLDAGEIADQPDLQPVKDGVARITDQVAELDAAADKLASRLRKALEHIQEAREEELANQWRKAAAGAYKHDHEHDKKHGKKHHHNHHDKEKKRERRRRAREELRKILAEVRTLNGKAVQFEQGFISKEGLVGRPWYKHLAVAPGRYLGYGATTLPGVTESLTLDKGNGTAYEVQRLADALNRMADGLKL